MEGGRERTVQKVRAMSTRYNGIDCPCFAETLAEIHAALKTDLNWIGEQVTINNFGYTVTENGFRSNHTDREYPADSPAFINMLAPGLVILIGSNSLSYDCCGYNNREIFEIVTLGKLPHISKRCPVCGQQLNSEEIEHYGACTNCHAAEVS